MPPDPASHPGSQSPVVTRFAPSPTGQLHVGGARTALYAWAFARRHSGKFLLRLEDTDQKRSSEASAQSILEDLRWLGLDWDNDPPENIPRQSQRLDRYHEVVRTLLDKGLAYGSDGAVRFRMGRDVQFDDAVYGHIITPGKDLEDFVIRKADGFPTFHLAVVVDDADMGVTHVIRGQEHLSNTPKHAALCDTLGLPRPTWAHLPSIMNPDGSKMSKRDKEKDLAAGRPPREIDVGDFRRSGYLPGVLLNYLALLGWNPGNDVERFDLGFIAQNFSLDRVNRANSKFDREKLAAFNGQTLQQLPPEAFTDLLRKHMTAYHPDALARLGNTFGLFARTYQPRSRTLEDPVKLGMFFFTPDDAVAYTDEKAVRKNLHAHDGEGLKMLRALREKLAAVEPWSGAAAHRVIEELAASGGASGGGGMGKVAQPLRVAVSGGTVSPPIDVTLDILGKPSTLARIDRCLRLCAPSPSRTL